MEQEQDRAAMGDEVTLDFEGFVDGVPFEGGKGEGYPLLLGSGMFIPGFEEQVAGICPEEEQDVHVTFPTQYVPDLAGKDATFHVKAHRIVRRSLPQLTDTFAQEQGFEDVSHLRRSIMEQAILQKQQAASNAFAEALMQQVVAGMEVQLPDSMVESQLTGILQELQQHLESQGASLSDYLQAAGLTMEDLRDHAREKRRGRRPVRAGYDGDRPSGGHHRHRGGAGGEVSGDGRPLRHDRPPAAGAGAPRPAPARSEAGQGPCRCCGLRPAEVTPLIEPHIEKHPRRMQRHPPGVFFLLSGTYFLYGTCQMVSA